MGEISHPWRVDRAPTHRFSPPAFALGLEAAAGTMKELRTEHGEGLTSLPRRISIAPGHTKTVALALESEPTGRELERKVRRNPHLRVRIDLGIETPAAYGFGIEESKRGELDVLDATRTHVVVPIDAIRSAQRRRGRS